MSLSPGNEDVALGVGDGAIVDGQLSESNCSANDDHCAVWGRLDDSDSSHCWMPLDSDTNPWMQVGSAFGSGANNCLSVYACLYLCVRTVVL